MSIATSAPIVGAVLIAFLVLAGLAISQSRRARRMDRLLSERTGVSAAVDPARAARLTSRSGFSQGGAAAPRPRRRWVAATVTAVVILGALAFGGWWFFVRGSSTAAPAARARPGPSRALPPDPRTAVPATVPPLPGGTTLYTVGVLNGTSVTGAARLRIVPLVRAQGYRIGRVDSAPVNDLTHSIVMWAPGKRLVAASVAHALNIARISPMDGVPPQLVGGADAVLVVGMDLLQGP